MRRESLFVAIGLLLVLVLVEVLSMAFVHFYAAERFQYQTRVENERFRAALLSAPSYHTDFFDAVTGWDEVKTPVTLFGEKQWASRPMGENGPVRVVTYGDSFTYGQDVAEEETWQERLGFLIGASVLNRGVRGFGPDQALMKFEEDRRRGWRTPPVVILAMLGENIARVVNVAPKYYWAHTDVMSLKPVFVGERGEMRWGDELLDDIDTEKGREAAFDYIVAHDFWYQENLARPQFTFPYVVSLFQTARYFGFNVTRWHDLWKRERPVRVMETIVKRFVQDAQEAGATPVFLFIPEPYDLKRTQEGKRPSYAAFRDKLRRIYTSGALLVVDVAEASFAGERFNLTPYAGHASVYGNRVIAQAVAAALPNQRDGLSSE